MKNNKMYTNTLQKLLINDTKKIGFTIVKRWGQ
jgi:hypothetical protein